MQNPYGFFDDAAREYVITRPDTPLPWLNYLGQDRFFGLCSNTGGGYTFWRDAKLRRLTRYRYNNVPMDVGGRYLYIRDRDVVWNPGWKPTKTKLDEYECRHGLGYTRLRSRKNDLEVEQTCFVPLDRDMEIWKVCVRNLSSTDRYVQLFSFVEFCLYEALNDMTNFQRTFSIGEVEVEGSSIYHKTEYRERRSHYTMFACTRKIDGFDTSREKFIGVHNGFHEPEAVLRGAPENSIANGWNPIGSHCLELHLPPGETQEFAFLLAYVEEDPQEKFESPGVLNKRKGRALVREFSAMAAVDGELARLGEYWNGHLAKFQVTCPNEHLQRMANLWNPYQCMATFNLSRSASFFESGIGRGMGFRDSNQDILGFVHLVPEKARQRILDIASTQLSDGTCYHQYQPLTKKGNAEIGGDFFDDHLWLILSTGAYIRETGDASILQEAIGYADTPESGETLLHHLETSIRFTQDHLGPHGLPLIGHADWNDCLNLNCFSTEPNESFQTAGDVEGSVAESLMIAGLFLYACRELRAMYRWLKRPEDAERIDQQHGVMLRAVEKHGWDGEWYRRAYDAEGRPVGSAHCEEGKIFIESQGWCVLGGAGADNGRARQALESVDRHLMTPHGAVLQQPAYATYHLHLGEVSSYPPGYKENGGVFCHNNPWIQLGWAKMGEGEKALQYYLATCPSTKEACIDTYKCEPYVYAQMIAGKDAAVPGEAKNSWLTGTAAWTFVVATQGILGVIPDYDGLRLNPCLPADWDDVRIVRQFRGAEYRIQLKREHSHAMPLLRVNGREQGGSLVPLAAAGTVVDVEFVLGPGKA